MSLPADFTRDDVSFWPCTEEDLPQILSGALEQLAEFQEKSPLDLSILKTALIEQTRQELPEYTKLMAGDRLLGWYRLARVGGVLELDDVNILEAYRSKGLGGFLMDKIFQMADREGQSVICTVSPDNQGALRFYQRHSFFILKREGSRIQLMRPAKTK